MKTRTELLDQDYLHLLNDKELAWINKFNKEYVGDSLDRKNLRKNLHRTKKLKKDCDDRNNSRNRDILTRAKASNQIIDYHTLVEEANSVSQEDEIIHSLDKNEMLNAISWLADEIDKDEDDLEESLIKDVKE